MDQASTLILRFLLAAAHVLPFVCAWKAISLARGASPGEEAEPDAEGGAAAKRSGAARWLAVAGWTIGAAGFAWGALFLGPPWFASTPGEDQPILLVEEKRGDTTIEWRLGEGFVRSSGFHVERADGKEAYIQFAAQQPGYWLLASARHDEAKNVVRFRALSTNPKLWAPAEWDVAAKTLRVGRQTHNLETMFQALDEE